MRNRWVEAETIKILRSRVQKCYYREGVNYKKNCEQVAKQYMDAVKGRKGDYTLVLKNRVAPEFRD